MLTCTASGGRQRPAGASLVAVAGQRVLDAAAEDQQASVLADVERVRRARAGPPSEAIWLIVVAGALVKRPARARRVFLV